MTSRKFGSRYEFGKYINNFARHFISRNSAVHADLFLISSFDSVKLPAAAATAQLTEPNRTSSSVILLETNCHWERSWLFKIEPVKGFAFNEYQKQRTIGTTTTTTSKTEKNVAQFSLPIELFVE